MSKNKKNKNKKNIEELTEQDAIQQELQEYMIGDKIRANDDDFIEMGIKFNKVTKMLLRKVVNENGKNIISPAFTTASHIEKGATQEYAKVLIHKISAVTNALYFKYITDDPICSDAIVEIIETAEPTFSLIPVEEWE